MSMKQELPLAKVYAILEPGPVVLLSTIYNGVANVMPMSWHLMMEFEPPLVGCVISEANHSFKAVMENCYILFQRRIQFIEYDHYMVVPFQRLQQQIESTLEIHRVKNHHDHIWRFFAQKVIHQNFF